MWLVTVAGASPTGMPSGMKEARILDPKEANPLKGKAWKTDTRWRSCAPAARIFLMILLKILQWRKL